MKTIVIATKNEGKLNEFKKLFTNDLVLGLNDLAFSEEIAETGQTFAENAKIKAKFLSERLGKIVLADDSGLEVAALGNEPGVHSARYAGNHDDEANNQLLLKKMENISDRRACFKCTICLYYPTGKSELFTGQLDGFITKKPVGTNGFGYDPCFYVEEYQKTLAQLSLTQKNKISHRAKAIAKLKEYWHENISNE